MLFRSRMLSEARYDDLQALVNERVRESRILDFKSAEPGMSDEEKRELLSDVVAFANTAGGHLVYGVEEQDGEASAVVGFECTDIDGLILRLENLLRDAVAPRIPGMAIHPIEITEGRYCVIVGIPKSWAAPHMVTFRNSSKFFARNSAGKFQLDVNEIRGAFEMREGGRNRITAFHLDRLAKIKAQDTPVALPPGPIISLHIVPLSVGDPSISYDVVPALEKNEMRPPIARAWSRRVNFDGVLAYSGTENDPRHPSYSQIFRNGTYEAVDGYTLLPRGDDRAIPGVAFERRIIEAARSAMVVQASLGVEGPFLAFAALLGVKGYYMAVSQHGFWDHEPRYIDRDELIPPDVLIEQAVGNPGRALRPIFDAIWNAAGWQRSINYGEDGEWRAHA